MCINCDGLISGDFTLLTQGSMVGNFPYMIFSLQLFDMIFLSYCERKIIYLYIKIKTSK